LSPADVNETPWVQSFSFELITRLSPEIVPLEELVPPSLRPAPELVPAIERELREKLDLKPAIVARLTRAVQHVSTTNDDGASSAAEHPTRAKQR